ncbi:MAG: helix-turn-helix domain-containing protein [Hyphomicrobium sp.]
MLKADVFCAQCASRNVIELLAEKWSLLIIHSLSQSPKRTGELRRHVGGISEKMLIQTLRGLERHGFVSRHAFPEVPPRVEYVLTPLGDRLSALVKALDGWVEENCAEILAAQRAFDAQKDVPA